MIHAFQNKTAHFQMQNVSSNFGHIKKPLENSGF